MERGKCCSVPPSGASLLNLPDPEPRPLSSTAPNSLLTPPLNPGLLGPRPLGVVLPREGPDPANNDSASPSAEKPVPFKEYVYASPPYVAFASSVQGEEAGLPVSGSNSFREKPEETGPWTESGVASPFPGPYGKVSPSAVLEKSKYLVWPFQVRSSFPIQA